MEANKRGCHGQIRCATALRLDGAVLVGNQKHVCNREYSDDLFAEHVPHINLRFFEGLERHVHVFSIFSYRLSVNIS